MPGSIRVGLMWHGDRIERDSADLTTSRFAKAADALRSVGLAPEPVVYNDDFLNEVREQALGLGALQVWVNPIEIGRDRSKLDGMLRELSQAGVKVFTHPDTIAKMGTKRVLIDTKGMSWGTDVAEYRTSDALAAGLTDKLRQGPRVLKHLRGHSGGGIWKVGLAAPCAEVGTATPVKFRHAQRGAVERVVPLADVLESMREYLASGGVLIDQAFQERLQEGMTRVYMVESRVGGYGHQAINALYPAPEGAPSEDAPQPGPRLYYPPDQPEFQEVGRRMEQEWVPELLKVLGMSRSELSLLWDADFLLGPKLDDGTDTYVLCEINVSSVSPYPEWANPLIAQTLLARLAS